MSSGIPRPPFPPAGGLRLGRGEPARSWWGRRWLSAAEAAGWRTLERGLPYARAGRVLSIEVKPGLARARVQGGRERPYEVTISARRIPREAWPKLASGLGAKAIFPAKLLAGELPPELERVFEEAGFPLFPAKGDLASGCGCSDPASPCKHASAALYLFAHELDHDPFLLLKLRGLERNDLLGELRRQRGRPRRPVPRRKPPTARPRPSPSPSGPASGVEDFFRTKKPLPSFARSALPPPGSRLLELGVPPFWRGESDFLETLRACFEAARKRALSL